MKQNIYKRGVALIMVLGMLSLLLVLALAAANFSRTESLVSEYSNDDLQAKFLLDHAIHSSVAMIHDRLLKRPPPNYDAENTTDPLPINPFPKPGSILKSSAGGTLRNDYNYNVDGFVGNGTGFLSGEALDYLPVGLRTSAENAGVNASWIQANNVMGRYAYVAINVTGFMDANIVPTNYPGSRMTEQSLEELEIYKLNEFANVNNNTSEARYFATNRNQRHAYWLDLKEINETQNFAADPVVSLYPLGHFYENTWWDWNSESWAGSSVIISNSSSVVSNENELITVFTSTLGVTEDIAEDMVYALADYLDTNDIPARTEGICMEAVPMINEFVLNTQKEEESTNITLTVDVELWYPFESEENSMEKDYTVTNLLIDFSGTTPSDLFNEAPDESTNTTFESSSQTNFHVARFSYKAATTSETISIKATLKKIEVVHEDDGTVDHIDTDADILFELSANQQKGVAFVDPRLNHSALNVNKYDTDTSGSQGFTLEDTNSHSNANMDQRGLALKEGKLFINNTDEITLLGEIGYLSIGTPWESIQLFDPNGNACISRLRTNALNQIRGITHYKIHPASNIQGLWEAILYKTPVETFPRTIDTTTNNIVIDLTDDFDGDTSEDYLTAIVNSITNELNENYISENALYGKTGWALIPVFNDDGDNDYVGVTNGVGLSHNQKESIIRNTMNLFNYNQNLFVVYVIAQTLYPDSNTGNQSTVVKSEKSAVFTLWRDPFPDGINTGLGNMAIKFIKPLDE